MAYGRSWKIVLRRLLLWPSVAACAINARIVHPMNAAVKPRKATVQRGIMSGGEPRADSRAPSFSELASNVPPTASALAHRDDAVARLPRPLRLESNPTPSSSTVNTTREAVSALRWSRSSPGHGAHVVSASCRCEERELDLRPQRQFRRRGLHANAGALGEFLPTTAAAR